MRIHSYSSPTARRTSALQASNDLHLSKQAEMLAGAERTSTWAAVLSTELNTSGSNSLSGLSPRYLITKSSFCKGDMVNRGGKREAVVDLRDSVVTGLDRNAELVLMPLVLLYSPDPSGEVDVEAGSGKSMRSILKENIVSTSTPATLLSSRQSG